MQVFKSLALAFVILQLTLLHMGCGGSSGTTGTSETETTNNPPSPGGDPQIEPVRTLYVAPDGDDANPGTAESEFATVEHALTQLSPGTQIVVREGTYYEGDLTPPINGTRDQPIWISAEPGAEVIVDGERSRWSFIAFRENDHHIIEGFELKNFKNAGVSTRHSGYITIRNVEAYANGAAGIAMNYADFPHAEYDAHMVVEDNVCYENGWGDGWASGIHINNKGQGGENSHHIIRRNVSFNNFDGSDHHTDGNGIMFDVGGGGSALIENNLVFNNGAAGIQVMDGVGVIQYNTTYRNGWDLNNPWQPSEIELIESHLPDSTIGSVVRGNIMWSRQARADEKDTYRGPFDWRQLDPQNFVFEDNLMWSDEPSEVPQEEWMVRSVVADPKFVNVATHNQTVSLLGSTFLQMALDVYDFALQIDSPAVDAVSAEKGPAHDIAKRQRPAGDGRDLGAYEN